MDRCNACREQLLDYLYDLLDGEEAQALRAHLESCPECQEALKQAQRQQSLLAAAAKMEFAEVRFEPPVEEPVPATREAAPTLLPLLPRRRVRPLRHWVAAASILLALGGVALSTLWAGHQADLARVTTRRHDDQVALIHKQLEDLDLQAKETRKRCDDELDGLKREEAEQFTLAVSGPRAVQPGASAEYKIETRGVKGQPVEAKIRAELRDADRPERAAIPLANEARGEGQVVAKVPADLPLDPAARYQLVVHARGDRDLEVSTPAEDLAVARPVYETFLTTDKPSYRPGEILHFRSLTLDRRTLQPAREELRLVYALVSPSGRVVPVRAGATNLVRPREDGAGSDRLLGPDGQPLRGIGGGNYLLPDGLEPGEYQLTVREELGRFRDPSRRLLVGRANPPRVAAELSFDKSLYRPGDTVTATCTAVGPGRVPLRDRLISLAVSVDGVEYDRTGIFRSTSRFQAQTDPQGKARIQFRLPGQVDQGAALLHAWFDDGSGADRFTWPVPVLDRLHVDFYPEGGELVAGLPCRVYFQATTQLDQPVEIDGQLLENGKPIPGVVVRTTPHGEEPGADRGLGLFTFTPRPGRTYELQVNSPEDIPQRFALPQAQADGVVLSVPRGVVAVGKPIGIEVQSKRPRLLVAALYCRGQLLDTLHLAPGQTKARFAPVSGAGGVCRVTVFEDRSTLQHPLPLPVVGAGMFGMLASPGAVKSWSAAADLLAGASLRRELVPVAERLVYRQPAEQLNLDLQADRFDYAPGQSATVRLRASDENRWATPAIVQAVVVDRNAIVRAGDRTLRSLPAHFLLASEVRRPEELEYADFLLGSHPTAAQALDLVLGTQGWRRFVERDAEPEDAGDPADGLLLVQARPAAKGPSIAERADRALAVCKAALEDLSAEQAEARLALEKAAADRAYLSAVADVDQARGFLAEARLVLPPVTAAVLLVLLAVGLLQALRRHLDRAVPWAAAAAGCAGLLWLGLTLSLPVPVDGTDSQLAMAPPSIQPPDAPKFGNPEIAPVPQLAGRPLPERENLAKDSAIAPGGGQGYGAAPGSGKPAAVPPPPAAFDDRNAEKKTFDREAQAPRKETGKDVKENAGDMKRALDLARKQEAEAKAALNRDHEQASEALDGKEKDKGDGSDAFRRNLMEEQRAQARLQTDGKGGAAPLPGAPGLAVREFAHQRGKDKRATGRDRTETLYWNPVLVLPGEGEAVFSFPLSDLPTSFEVTVFGHTLDGRLGAATYVIESREPASPALGK
jgi:hypothetical protein